MYNSKSNTTNLALMTAASSKPLPAGKDSNPLVRKAKLKKALAGALVQLARGFHKFDSDHSGDLGPEEFRSALRYMRLPCADEEACNLLFEELDFDHSGTISYVEVMRYSLLEIISGSSERLSDIFRLWDVDCSGTIDENEFRGAIRTLGVDVPRATVTKLFNELDEDRSGELEYGELMRKLIYPKASQQISCDLAAKVAAKAQQVVGIAAAAGSARAAVRLKRHALATPPQQRRRRPPPSTSSSSRPPSPTPSVEAALDEDADRASPLELAAQYRASVSGVPSAQLVEAEMQRIAIEEHQGAVRLAAEAQQVERGTMRWPHYARHAPEHINHEGVA